MSYSSSLSLPLPLLELMNGPYRAALSSMRAINHMGLFKCKVLLIKIKLKTQFLNSTSHISSAK